MISLMRKVFDAREWLAAMCSHVPNPGEQTVRYYGWYSNVSRGKRKEGAEEDTIPNIIESDRSPAACRKSWARLIQKIYEVDPLTCPKCGSP
ncbi:MAG: transposase [Proteobacteria bacterium]|nr:transposase [Pseudomonadota bacterium]